MNTQQDQVPQNVEELKEIPKWARRYAESRTAPMIIWHIVFIVCFGLAFLSVYFFLKGRFVFAT